MVSAATDTAVIASISTPVGPVVLTVAVTVTAHRPFCSKRCAGIDLGRWLGEEYRITDPERSIAFYRDGFLEPTWPTLPNQCFILRSSANAQQSAIGARAGNGRIDSEDLNRNGRLDSQDFSGESFGYCNAANADAITVVVSATASRSSSRVKPAWRVTASSPAGSSPSPVRRRRGD